VIHWLQDWMRYLLANPALIVVLAFVAGEWVLAGVLLMGARIIRDEMEGKGSR
jgi:hypothetical protein